MAEEVFVPPSASGPRDKPFEAKEGVVTNPGVRTVPIAGVSGSPCPNCKAQLQRKENKDGSSLIYCPSCGYDNQVGYSNASPQISSGVRIVSPRGIGR